MANAVAGATIHFIQYCIQWSSLALIYYDYVLTFGLEVRYIWRERFRFSTILYYFCRYSLVANVVYLLTISNKIHGKYGLSQCASQIPCLTSKTSCATGFVVSSALSVIGRLAVVVVWTARTYAVFGKNIWILIFFSSIGLMITILDIIEVPKSSCKGGSNVPIVGGLLAIMMVVFEILAATLTTYRSIQALNVSGPWWKQKRGFHYLILQQGVLYFCLVTVLTVTNLALNVAIPGGFFQRLLNAYTIPLSGLMTARFLLHLREWEAHRDGLHSDAGGVGGISTGINMDRGGKTSTNIDFGSQPHSRTLNSEDENSEMEETESGRSRGFIDEFGEDPVQTARVQASYSLEIARGGIVEEPRV